jgi:hypothetical protein
VSDLLALARQVLARNCPSVPLPKGGTVGHLPDVDVRPLKTGDVEHLLGKPRLTLEADTQYLLRLADRRRTARAEGRYFETAAHVLSAMLSAGIDPG